MCTLMQPIGPSWLGTLLQLQYFLTRVTRQIPPLAFQHVHSTASLASDQGVIPQVRMTFAVDEVAHKISTIWFGGSIWKETLYTLIPCAADTEVPPIARLTVLPWARRCPLGFSGAVG